MTPVDKPKDKRKANLGKPFEAKLDVLHKWYNGQGVCSVFRTPPPMRIVSALPSTRQKPGPPQFRCEFVGDGPPDYVAQANGVSFMFDAKMTEHPSRWSFNDLPEHQARRFDAHMKHGGVAFVLVELGFKQWLLPWTHLGPLWWAWSSVAGRAAPGTASVPMTEPWVRPVPSCDWLPVALGAAR
jgi:recombination protein U